MALPFLQTLGLTKTESDIYEYLVQKGELTASQIASDLKLKRPTAYHILELLKGKGLVVIRSKNRKQHFTPAPPTRLLELAQAHRSELARAEDSLNAFLPSLTSSYVLSVERPIIRMYEGIDGIKKANLEVLAEKKEILAYVYADEQIDTLMESFWKKYYALRKRDQIFVRSITPNNKAGTEYKKRDTEELRQTRLVPLEKFPINIEKNIVGDKVVFFSKNEGNLIATIIENAAIANTERAIFELAWKEAERLDTIVSS